MRTTLFTFLACIICACGGRPVETLTAAETALLADAELTRKCAPDEYAAAEKKFAEAQKLADKGENDKAAAAARAAKKLAVAARDKALARKEECLNPKTSETKAEDFVEKEPVTEAPIGDDAGMQTIFFSYNVHELSERSRATVNHNAQWLRENTAQTVTVAGHCDGRGSTEFNLALGERRAQTARNYLISLGIPKERIGVISYGEEQLDDYGEGENAHARNRRAEFRTGL